MSREDLVYWEEVLAGEREPVGGTDIEELCGQLIAALREARARIRELEDPGLDDS
jgi:hypothetical protein